MTTLGGWIEFLKTLTIAGLWTIAALLVWGFIFYFASHVIAGIRKGVAEVKKIPWGIRR